MKKERLYKYLSYVCCRLKLLKEQRTAVALLNPILIVLISCIGIAFMYAIQKGSHGVVLKWRMQIVWLCIGYVVYYITSHFHYKLFFQNAHWMYLFSVFLLLLLWTPLGRSLGGSRRWLNLGFITIQPSDFSKIATLLMIASVLTRTQLLRFKDSVNVLLQVFLLSGISFGLIFLQPDLGSAMVFPVIVFGILFVSKLSLRFFGYVFLITCCALFVISLDTRAYYLKQKGETFFLKPFLPLKDYQRNRILAFAVPTSIDPKGVNVGWHLKQSLIAIGSGGVFGKGWTKNTQAQLGYLPKAASLDDFIFSVLAEETGLFGTYFVLVLYFILIFNTLRIATMSRDRFGGYLCVGVALLLFTHVWINIGMTLGIMPITGLPLPFLSYGGSFMLVCFFCQGLVQSVYRFRFAE